MLKFTQEGWGYIELGNWFECLEMAENNQTMEVFLIR